MAWTAFDAAVIFILVVAFLTALIRGFTTMALTLFAWIGAALVTLYGFEPAADQARRLITPPELADVLTVPVLFIGSLLLLRLLASFVGDRVKAGPAGALDRSLGGLLGLAVGFVLVSASFLLLNAIIDGDRQPAWVREARLRPMIGYGADMLVQIAPSLTRRIEQNRLSEEVMGKARESIPHFEEQTRKLVEPAYNDLQRRALEELVQKKLEAECDPDQDEDCPMR